MCEGYQIDGNFEFYCLMADYNNLCRNYWYDILMSIYRGRRLEIENLKQNDFPYNHINYHYEWERYYTDCALDNCPPERVSQ